MIAQAKAQVLADGDKLQLVLLKLAAHDDERLLVEVVYSQCAGERGLHHIQASDLPEWYDLLDTWPGGCGLQL